MHSPGLDLAQPPFDLLDAAAHTRLTASVDIGFFPAGQQLIEAGQPSTEVMVVMKGQIQAFDTDPTGLEEHFADYGPGDILGAWAVMAGRARHSYRCKSDCLLHLIPAELFRQLLAEYPAFSAWFNEGLAVKGQARGQSAELAQLMATQVGDAQLAPAVQIDADSSIASATLALKQARVDCLLVNDPAHAEPGILTRTDLLEAITLKGLTPDTPVATLANRPVIHVRHDEVLFQALVVMTHQHIERVAVQGPQGIIGTLGMAELLSHYASHSHLVSLRLARARTLSEVIEAAHGMSPLIRTLHAQGARMSYLMELVSALNSRIMQRIFELCVPACWHDRLCLLVLGSEGRREQLVKTDQDNALILDGDLPADEIAARMQDFSDALGAAGYPPCPGQVMVNNPHWQLTSDAWRKRIDGWRMLHTPQAALDLAITLDARPIAGNPALFAPLQNHLQQLGEDGRLLNQLASATLNFDTPLTLFGKVRDDGDGIDLKKGGIFPVVHGLRCLALKHDIRQTNTLARCTALQAAGHLPDHLAHDLAQAFTVMQRLRLDAQLKAMATDTPPDNRIHPDSMNRIERELLRDALRIVKTFRQEIKTRFHLAQ